MAYKFKRGEANLSLRLNSVSALSFHSHNKTVLKLLKLHKLVLFLLLRKFAVLSLQSMLPMLLHQPALFKTLQVLQWVAVSAALPLFLVLAWHNLVKFVLTVV